MDRWQAMKVFVKVADAGSFADAARQMNMSPPAVTRAVASLEETIGARLFVRTTRSVKLTQSGASYVEDCRRLLADLAEAEAAAAGAHTSPKGLLTITASVLFGQMYVLPILTDFLDAHPAVTGRALFLDRMVNLIDEGVDVAIRIGHLTDSDFRAIRVGSVRQVVCGAPSYLEQHGVPMNPSDLSQHRIIAPTGAWSSLDWSFGSEQKSAVTVSPRLFCNTNEAAMSAAIKGWGLTRLLSYQIGPALLDGRLHTVLSDHEEPPLPIHIVHGEGRHVSAKVRAFVDAAASSLRANRLLN